MAAETKSSLIIIIILSYDSVESKLLKHWVTAEYIYLSTVLLYTGFCTFTLIFHNKKTKIREKSKQ